MMARRVVMVGLLVVGLVAMSGAKTEAHYIQVSGRLIYHSITCDSVLKNVQNLDNNPAIVTCEVVGVVVETECSSPVGNIVRGRASRPIAFFGAVLATQTLSEKKKGRAHANIVLPGTEEPDLGISHEDSGCNNHWTLERALVREADLTINAYSCGVDGICTLEDIIDGNLATTSLSSCTLPADVNFDTIPLPEPRDFVCSLESFTHVR